MGPIFFHSLSPTLYAGLLSAPVYIHVGGRIDPKPWMGFGGSGIFLCVEGACACCCLIVCNHLMRVMVSEASLRVETTHRCAARWG
jgi:hypothetical protein